MEKKLQNEIMENVAGFFKYGIQDNRFISCNKKLNKEIRDFIGKLAKEEFEKYNAVCVIPIDKVNMKLIKKYVNDYKDKKIVFVINIQNLPKTYTDIFYFLSRLGETSEFLDGKIQKTNVSIIILGENLISFMQGLDDATISSMQIRGIYS